jgi:hypothetical protein
MPRLSWLFALPFVSLTVSLPAKAAPQATIQSGWPSAFRLNSEACSGFPDDALTLTVSDHGKQVANDVFCSSYGRAAASVVTDKSGKTFVLLAYSEGRGNGQAVTNYLDIDRLQRPDLLEVLRVPLSWATGVDQRFTYSYEIELPASGGIRIHLKGQNLGQPAPLDLDCCVPDTRNLTIDISR